MSNIEDDIKTLRKIILFYKDLDTLYDNDKCLEIKAIENILLEREQDKARIKELEEKTLLISPYYIKQNYIPKQKVKEILDKAEVMDYYTLPDVINDLQELLEEGE